MLAKEIKMKTLRKQRDYIEARLTSIILRENGNAVEFFIGYIYPEVLEYFEKEGFDIRLAKSDELTAEAKGMNVYVFSVKDDIKLTEAELNEAMNYPYELEMTLYNEEEGEDATYAS